MAGYIMTGTLIMLTGVLAAIFPRAESRPEGLALGVDIIGLVVIAATISVPGVSDRIVVVVGTGFLALITITFANLVRTRFRSGRYQVPW